jgi:FAD binding domain
VTKLRAKPSSPQGASFFFGGGIFRGGGEFGIGVERGIALSTLYDDGCRIAAELLHANGAIEREQFRYLVGCDGAHSAVRRALQIGFPGDRFPMSFMLGDVTIDWDLPRGFTNFVIVPRDNATPDFLVAIPLPERNRYRVTMLASTEFAPKQGEIPEHGIASEQAGPSLEQLQQVADRLLPEAPKLGDLRWSSLFGISTRLADTYRVGNAFIAGDAAHIHPPTGGQGMNTGIQDAYNLAWKLALVLRGDADAALLDSYDSERRPVGAEVVERTRAASMSFGRERMTKERRLADTQLLINYRDSKWITSSSLAETWTVGAGDRAPDVIGLRRENVGFPLRLFDLLRGTTHVLVCMLATDKGGAAHAFAELSAQLLNENDARLRIVAIVNSTGEFPDIPGVAVVRDETAAFAASYGARPGSICLVRPDGYLAYVAEQLDNDKLRNALALDLGRRSAAAVWRAPRRSAESGR